MAPPTPPVRPESDPPQVTALVLCGGAARRFGRDKTAADLDGRSVLDVVLSGLPTDWAVVAIGPSRPTTRGGVVWTQEDPLGGGPLAGIAAGLRLVTSPVTVVLGGDMPFAGPTAVRLVEVLTSPTLRPTEPVRGVEAVGCQDASGRVQPLLMAGWTEALRRALPEQPHGIPAKRLLDGLRMATIDPDPGGEVDIDTPEDLERARRRLDP